MCTLNVNFLFKYVLPLISYNLLYTFIIKNIVYAMFSFFVF